MITIIKTGTKKYETCTFCGCYFSYDNEDVEIDMHPLAKRGTVKCPQCNKNVTVKISGEKTYTFRQFVEGEDT